MAREGRGTFLRDWILLQAERWIVLDRCGNFARKGIEIGRSITDQIPRDPAQTHRLCEMAADLGELRAPSCLDDFSHIELTRLVVGGRVQILGKSCIVGESAGLTTCGKPVTSGMAPHLSIAGTDATTCNQAVNEWLASLEARGIKDRSRKVERMRRVCDCMGIEQLAGLTPKLCEQYLIAKRTSDRFGKPIGGKTHDMILVDIRQFTAFCKKREWIDGFDMGQLDAVGVSNWEEPDSPGDFTMEEVKRLIAAARADESSPKPKRAYLRSTLYWFMWESAVRIGQAYRTQWREFDLEHLRYDRRKSKSKGKRQSSVPISADLAAELRTLRPNDAEPNDFVWYNKRGGADPSKYSRINDRVLTDDMKSAGVPLIGPDGRRRTFHSFRHGRASQLVADGVHPKVAQQLLDHADIRTTMDIYSRVETHALASIVDDAFKKSSPSQKKDLTSEGGIGEDTAAIQESDVLSTLEQPASDARPALGPVSLHRTTAGRASESGRQETAFPRSHRVGAGSNPAPTVFWCGMGRLCSL